MFKNIIAPVQAWLLSRGQCVGCGMPLKKAKSVKSKGDLKKISCKCGRVFMHDTKTGKYRRTLFEEV